MYAARVRSALKISAGKLPFLGTLSCFKLLNAVTISNFDGLSALISKSVFFQVLTCSTSGLLLESGGVQYPLKLKCSFHLWYFSFSDVIIVACWTLIGIHAFLLCPHSFFYLISINHPLLTCCYLSSVCHIVNDVFTVTFCGIFFLLFFLDGDACGEGVCNSFDLVRNRNKIWSCPRRLKLSPLQFDNQI